MNFTKIIGKIDPKLVQKAEEKLSKTFLELGTKYDLKFYGTKWGGDPLLFTLLYPLEHVCTLNIPTAGTDGKRFYWNPKFVVKLSEYGLRIVCAHEAWHAIYMHPERRGSRNHKLWNIAVDYIVNGTVMSDLYARLNKNQELVNSIFTKHLGRFMKLDQLCALMKNPSAKIPGFEDLNISKNNASESDGKLPSPMDDRELTPEEKKLLEKKEKGVKFYYADPTLSEDMKSPEKIYDLLYKLLSSGNGTDIFNLGGTLDDHFDSEESRENLAKRISDAIETTKHMAGHVPGELLDEFGKLVAAKIRWQDIIRTKLNKARSGNSHNDWTRFRTRPMFAGVLIPKRKTYTAHFGCLLDTSASMSKDDIAFGLSQLQSLDERSEGTITCADAEIYWEKSTKIRKASGEELRKIKIIGRGGTMFADYFKDYEKNIGKCDFLIVITDGYLMDTDIANMINPGIETIWLITANSSFKPPFGRCFSLKD